MLTPQSAPGAGHDGNTAFEFNTHGFFLYSCKLGDNTLPRTLLASGIPHPNVIQGHWPPLIEICTMELKSDIIHTPPRDSASVVLLRDGARGLEVFLVKRHGLSDVLGGAYVFPGGKLDAADAELDASVHLDQTAEGLHAALGEPEVSSAHAKGLFVAALREAFEECGVLIAHGANAQATAKARELLQSGVPFNEVVAELAIRLHTKALAPWSRWITPKMASVSSKRFDTRFFVAAIPNEQVAAHDNFETTQSAWLSPRAALEQYWQRDIELAPPQIMGLSHLSRHVSVHSVLQEARNQQPPLICPEPFDENGERVLCYPGDPQHSVTQRALPGPSRLIYRNRRFEPQDGFEALFG
jgi:8-oxo-dGTP pyrophosphatase MutT (NUDIX family)